MIDYVRQWPPLMTNGRLEISERTQLLLKLLVIRLGDLSKQGE